MPEVELVIHTVPHEGEPSHIASGELSPRRFPSVEAAKIAADELPVPDGWQRKETIRDVASGLDLFWRTDRVPGWQPA